ncbi:hypothetical protein EWM64_g7279 [Hericium alpestre]|uniref:Uncharacterized protein n=1 Tax=Hericium alpestre TaxID=135208 RepID=A0A4Y9ZRR9_9AGAM|nr:hypothetical protein EWM64_g7279 [Hericium alpestre]
MIAILDDLVMRKAAEDIANGKRQGHTKHRAAPQDHPLPKNSQVNVRVPRDAIWKGWLDMHPDDYNPSLITNEPLYDADDEYEDGSCEDGKYEDGEYGNGKYEPLDKGAEADDHQGYPIQDNGYDHDVPTEHVEFDDETGAYYFQTGPKESEDYKDNNQYGADYEDTYNDGIEDLYQDAE